MHASQVQAHTKLRRQWQGRFSSDERHDARCRRNADEHIILMALIRDVYISREYFLGRHFIFPACIS